MSAEATCKCGTDAVTKDNAVDALKWAINGCEDCGEDVKFKFETKGLKRPGRGN